MQQEGRRRQQGARGGPDLWSYSKPSNIGAGRRGGGGHRLTHSVITTMFIPEGFKKVGDGEGEGVRGGK